MLDKDLTPRLDLDWGSQTGDPQTDGPQKVENQSLPYFSTANKAFFSCWPRPCFGLKSSLVLLIVLLALGLKLSVQTVLIGT